MLDDCYCKLLESCANTSICSQKFHEGPWPWHCRRPRSRFGKCLRGLRWSPPLPYLHYHSSNYYKTTCDLDVVETKNAFRKAYNYTLRDCFCRIANLRARRNTRLSAGQLLPCSATLLLLLLLGT